ncbi:6186_t:CDS:2, partial [Scutellospora calospora]
MAPRYLLFFLFPLFLVSVISSQCVATVYPACYSGTACKCPQPPSALPQGEYCGGQIRCDPCHVYECNPQGGTCDYGYRDSCICAAVTTSATFLQSIGFQTILELINSCVVIAPLGLETFGGAEVVCAAIVGLGAAVLVEST